MAHTPTPWTLHSTPKDYYVKGPDGQVVFGTEPYADWSPDEETDAAFIVKACNMHDELLTALRDCVENGLIYWEPNTERGEAQKDLMVKHLTAIIHRAGVL